MRISRKTADIFVCTLWWLTVSIVFPCQARKRGLIRHGWVRLLLTLLSPAALLTYLVIYFIILIGDVPGFDPELALFNTREEIIALTGIEDLPEFVYKDYSYDWWEGIPTIRYTYTEPLPESARNYFETVCKDSESVYWTASEAADNKIEHNTHYTYRHGWMTGLVDKPSNSLPENMHVTVTFGEMGFDVTYHSNGPSYPGLDEWVCKESLSQKTGMELPSFEVIDYECRHRLDPSAVITIRFKKELDQDFLRKLKDPVKWNKEDGFYSFQTDVEENARQAYSIRIFDDDSRIARICCDTV